MLAFLPLFFASGAASLTYQTLWARQLHLVFGTSTFAIATVLAAFMAGLGLGGLAAGRIADRVRAPLRVYAALELGIGAYALAFPALLGAILPLYLAAWRTLEPGPVAFGVIQLVLVGGALLLPTAAMGATLPLLARFATERLGAAGSRVGTLYAVNTAGAVFGVWLAGFVLLPAWGLWRTTIAAAATNFLVAGLALALHGWSGDAPRVLDDLDAPRAPRGTVASVTLAMGLAGFAGLVYEVTWMRVLALVLGPSVYAFSIMLLALLGGIALGGWAGGPLADRARRRWGLTGTLRLLAAAQLGVAALTHLLMHLYPRLPYWYVWQFDFLDGTRWPTAMWIVSMVLAAVVMAPPALLMGASFPLAVRAVIADPDRLGGPVGTLYGVNTLGGVVGSVLAGFVLLPNLAIAGTATVAAWANVGAAAVLARGSPWMLAACVVVAAAVQRPPWDPMRMTAGTYHYVSHFSDHSRHGITHFGVASYDLLYYREGLSAVVTVGHNHDSQGRWLAVNGKVEASTVGDMPTQLLCALLPMQFADDPHDVLVVGLASGITAGSVALEHRVQRLDVVEIEPATVEAAAFFDPWNRGVLRDPRTRIVSNDGRNHLLLTDPQTYDVVINEPSNPWITGVSNLFTREYFALGRSRLKPGGVWSQWVQTYALDDADLRSLLGTFADVFPHVLVYITIDHADLVLVGSDAPLEPSRAAARRLLADPAIAAALAEVDVKHDVDLIARFQMDRPAVLALSAGVERNTDDNMRVEYSAPLKVHTDTSADNDRLLVRHATLPFADFAGDPLALADLGHAYRSLDDEVRAVKAFAAAAAMLPPSHPLRADLLRAIEAE